MLIALVIFRFVFFVSSFSFRQNRWLSGQHQRHNQPFQNLFQEFVSTISEQHSNFRLPGRPILFKIRLSKEPLIDLSRTFVPSLQVIPISGNVSGGTYSEVPKSMSMMSHDPAGWQPGIMTADAAGIE